MTYLTSHFANLTFTHSPTQILTINGINLVEATKQECFDILQRSRSVIVEVQYEPHGFAFYDEGEELRRVSMLSFAQPDPSAHDQFDSRYLGATQVKGT